jgi:hypothetical protein
MSFLVDEGGIVYEADRGEETVERARTIDAYAPVGQWARAAE